MHEYVNNEQSTAENIDVSLLATCEKLDFTIYCVLMQQVMS